MPTVTHIIDQNLPVYATGNQTISGNKIFGADNISLTTPFRNSPILGGSNNTITGSVDKSFIVNGFDHIITGSAGDSFILNGVSNRISADGGALGRTCRSYVSNGFSNTISGGSCYAIINNGLCNIIDDSSRATIGNGDNNYIIQPRSCYIDILNGASNLIQESCYSSILQGASNCLGRRRTGVNDTLPKACLSTIVNGSNNRIIGDFNLIGGGSFNNITGNIDEATSCEQSFSTKSNVIVGGANNSILNVSCAAILGGRYNEINHNGATIIGDGASNIKTSKAACSLLLSFSNGIYLESPIINYAGAIDGNWKFNASLVFSENLLYLSQASGQISGSGYTGYYDGGQFLGRVKLSQNNTRLVNVGNTWTAKDSSRIWQSIAMSSDGKYQSAVAFSSQIYVSSDYGNTWTAKESSRNWVSISMSSDGKYQSAVVSAGKIYDSSDYGNTWTAKETNSGGESTVWRSIAMSSDGRYQSAVVGAIVNGNGGQIYASSDYGYIWTVKISDSNRDWRSIAMSSDGRYQSAVVDGGQIYVSSDYGNIWAFKDSNRAWRSIAMSSDGRYQSAVVDGGQIYVSNNYGNTWAAKDSSRTWQSVAMSSDGKYQSAVPLFGQLYVSNNYGNTWTAKDSSRAWQSVAMSSDGKYQSAVVNGGEIYVSVADEIIDGNFTADNIYGNNLVYKEDVSPNTNLPIDSVRYARMPFGIKATTAPQGFNMAIGKASIVPFYIGKKVSNYKAISQRLGASANGPWTIRVALYDINSGVSSPKFIESSNIQFNTETVSQQKIANFTGNGSSLIPGWYAHVSWVVSGNGTLTNTSSCTWSNRPFLGITGYGSEIPGGVFGELYTVINNLTGSFYETGSPTGIGTIMTTNLTGTDMPWFFPYY